MGDPKDKKPPVASAVVIRHSEFPDLILHGKRKDTNEWSIPGGHVHNEESLKDAAVRETKEETGLELNLNDLEHIGAEHYNTQEDKNLTVHLFVCKKPYHHESMDFTGDKDEEFKELKFINPLEHDDLYQPNGENIVVTYLKGELKKPEIKKAEEDYKGEHEAPKNDGFSKPIHNLKDIYPDDIYGSNAAKYYGHGVPYDQESINHLHGVKDKPNKMVRIYRAVPHKQLPKERMAEIESHKAYILKTGKIPKGVNASDRSNYYNQISDEYEKLKTLPDQPAKKLNINPGDWVTLNRKYAKEHGQANLGNKYKIVSKVVPAKHVYTDSNSIHEFGYDPSNLNETNKSEFKNIEIYQFFHNVIDNLIKVEVKDKNNLQVAKADFKIEFGDLVLPQTIEIQNNHSNTGLSKEIYKYVNEIVSLAKEELIKMSQPALRFKGLKKLPTRPEQDVKFISDEPLEVPSITEEDKAIEAMAGGPRIISRQTLENKKTANKILMAQPRAKEATPKHRESQRKAAESAVSGQSDIKVTPEGTFITRGYTEAYKDDFSQPYIKPEAFKAGKAHVVQEHEAAHHLLNILRAKYGEDTKNRLVDHLLNVHLHPNEREAIEKFVRSKPSYKDLPENEINEEILTHTRDLLTNKIQRQEHNALKKENPANWQPIDYNRLKASWKQLTRKAKKITEEDLNRLMAKKSEVNIDILFKARKPKLKKFKRFYLNRKEDHEGNNGTGIVAVGVQFPDGKCLVNWMTDTPSFNFYNSLKDVNEVHGHDGDTEIKFMDDLSKTEEIKKYEDVAQKFSSRFKYTRKDPLRKLPFLFLNKRFIGKD